MRRSMTLVLQDTHLFTGTIYDNIRYGHLKATDADCERAAKIACADEFIRKLPNGYNTVMTNLGDINVMLGQQVLAGEPVGRMDPDKPEMYLEVRRGNKAVDPAQLFKEED